MHHIVEVLGQAGAISIAEIFEPGADSFHHLRCHVGGTGDGGLAADRITLTGDIDLEVDRSAGWIVPETTQEHPCFGYVFGLAEGAGTLQENSPADIVIWSGDPLEVTSAADQVIIGGEIIPMVSRQTLLRDRYLPENPEMPRTYIKP